MSTQTLNLHEIIEHLPIDSRLIRYGISWEDYEALLNQVGEARGLRISYDDGTLQIMTSSSAHENYAWFIGSLVGAIGLRLRINIRFFGSTTMKQRKSAKGAEPDACFYVQSAGLIGNRMQLDFATDPPPDIAVEIDIHHGSISKFPIYAALGVPEIWHYDGTQLRIHLLKQDEYILVSASQALPMLTGDILTDFLTRLRDEGEFQTILAFDEWLRTQAGDGGRLKHIFHLDFNVHVLRADRSDVQSALVFTRPLTPGPRPRLYSYLSATIGSTFVARCAGM